jgi:hypothetical protein
MEIINGVKNKKLNSKLLIDPAVGRNYLKIIPNKF